MATPRFYWYPDASGSLEVLDLGEELSDLQEIPLADADDSYGRDGQFYRLFHASRLRVRIVLERFGPSAVSALERDLQTLQAHLDRGYSVGFSLDHDKTWAASVTTTPSRGDVTIYTGGNAFSAWNSAGSPAEDDEMVLESAPPESLREYFKCGALATTPPTDIARAGGLLYSYQSSAVVRWRDFYPKLRRPKDLLGRPIVTHEHRKAFTLDLTLEYSVQGVLDLWSEELGTAGGVLPLRDAGAPQYGSVAGFSLDQLVSSGLIKADWWR